MKFHNCLEHINLEKWVIGFKKIKIWLEYTQYSDSKSENQRIITSNFSKQLALT